MPRCLGIPDGRVVAVSRSGGGTSWETYLIKVHGAGAPLSVAVKRAPSAGVFATYDVEREVRLLELAREAGCPAPRVKGWVATSGEERGYYAMEFVAGLIPTPITVSTVIPDEKVRARVGTDVARLMARLHAAPATPATYAVLGTQPDPDEVGHRTVETWLQAYRQFPRARDPVLDLAYRWLADHADDVSGRIAFTHNDLHTGNFVVEDDRVVAVLDWEGAEWNDPVCDVAKFLVPTYAAGSTLAGGLVGPDEFLDAYAATASWRPDAPTLHFWTVLSLVRTMTILIRGASSYLAGATNDLRYVNMAHKIRLHADWLIEYHRRGYWGAS